jgi:hypothetical protein
MRLFGLQQTTSLRVKAVDDDAGDAPRFIPLTKEQLKCVRAGCFRAVS